MSMRQSVFKPYSQQQILAISSTLTELIPDSRPVRFVNNVISKLIISSNYLSDMLRSNTGQSAQQRIHQMLIDKAKAILISTNLSVSEIAYLLGFEYPQSFSKLYTNKTHKTPTEFRARYN